MILSLLICNIAIMVVLLQHIVKSRDESDGPAEELSGRLAKQDITCENTVSGNFRAEERILAGAARALIQVMLRWNDVQRASNLSLTAYGSLWKIRDEKSQMFFWCEVDDTVGTCFQQYWLMGFGI